MKRIAVSQRVDVVESRGERRDALDQRWSAFLARCDAVALPVPNDPASIADWIRAVPFDGLLLTGGNDLGAAPERDRTETLLLEHCLTRRIPVFGVCRGMQLVQAHFGVALEPVEGHVTQRQTISVGTERVEVNSYHCYGARETVPDLEVFARAGDGVIKGVRHRTHALEAVMWHPERMDPFAPADIERVRGHFSRLEGQRSD